MVGKEILLEVGAKKKMIEVTDLSVKKFKNVCCKKKAEIELFRQVPNRPARYGKQSSIFNYLNLQLWNILNKFNNAFQASLLQGLPRRCQSHRTGH